MTPCTITLLLCSFWAVDTVADSAPTAPSSASEVVAPDPVPLLLHLYQAQDYPGLRTEALRASFDPTLSPTVAGEVVYLEALAQMKLGEQDAALDTWDQLLRADPGGDTGQMAQLRIADAWLDLAPRLGVNRYQSFLDSHPQSVYRPYAAYQTARGLVGEGQLGIALTVLDSEGFQLAPEHRAALTDPRRWKRPMLASALSGALPGAGQLYARRPQEAASAFFVNGLFISGMVLAAKKESWPAFGALAFFGVGFYMGNIYGAADAAIRYNRGIRDEALDALAPYAPPEPLPQRPESPAETPGEAPQ